MGLGASSEECENSEALEVGAHEAEEGTPTGDAPEVGEVLRKEAEVLAHEPGEAQREPDEWPLPLSASVLANVASWGPEGCCARRCRQILRILGRLLVVFGLIVALVGVFGRYWVPVKHWAVHHSFELGGSMLVLLGLVIRLVATSPSRSDFPESLAWDDTVVGEVGAYKMPRFTFNIWNDAARFGSDREALERLVSNSDDSASRSCPTEELFNEPELRDLVYKARTKQSERMANRIQAVKRGLIEQCRTDLEAGMSLRRLRQKLEPRCFVLDFTAGDEGIDTQIQMLRDAVSFLLTVCTPFDEVVLRVTSLGGRFGDYGLASAQASRFRRAGVRFVACVDVAAASGGYMLACTSDHLVAAPFAVLGSIGVVGEMPNFHRILQRHDVDYLQFTAGRFKRTVGVMTKNTDEGIAKFQEELDNVHSAFIALVAEGRGSRIEGGAIAVSTGEKFLGSEALSRGLVDELATSDEYLRRRAAAGLVIVEVCHPVPSRSLMKDLLGTMVHSAQHTGSRIGKSLTTVVQASMACLTRLMHAEASGAHGPAEWLLRAEMDGQGSIYTRSS